MFRPKVLLLCAATAVSTLFAGCNTVSDMVTSNIPDNHHGRVRIVVRVREQEAVLYKGKSEVAESRISTGREGHHTPVGHFSVQAKDADHRSSLYGNYVDNYGRVVVANVDVRKRSKPSGTHFVGASMPYFLQILPGYGLHAGYLPGYPASHGCVRMPYWKARQFFNAAHVGTPVTIVD